MPPRCQTLFPHYSSRMNYAAYVEAKGYNVILPAELKAKSELPAEINKLVMKANKKAIELFGNAA